jgi:hypothetical protein
MIQEGDTTIDSDEGFESALDISTAVSDGPVRQARISDPFVLKQDIPSVIVTRGSGPHEPAVEEVESGAAADEEDTGDVSQDLDETDGEKVGNL